MEWTGARYADSPTVEVEILVDAPPARVWPLISDIHLMPQVSTELQRVEWQDGATGPATGARFTGWNERPNVGAWQTTSTVVECEEPTVFAWAVGDVAAPAATWRFTLAESGAGTTVRQWVQMGPGRSLLNRLIDATPEAEQKIVYVRMREYETAMTANLAEIKVRAERAR